MTVIMVFPAVWAFLFLIQGKDDGTDKEEEKQIVEVAKHLRHTVAVKKAQIKGEKVEYFSGKCGKLYVYIFEAHGLRMVC